MRLIDADALKAHIMEFACDPCKKFGADRDGIRCPFCNTGNLLGEIDEAPTVDVPERNVGKWIEYNYPGAECVYCSNCKEEYYPDDLLLGGNDYPNYCPHCGADMRERREDAVH